MTDTARSDEAVEQAQLSATVYGRVQGVYFRYFVRNAARKLGLTGYVRNIPGSAVEVRAEGEKTQLDELLGRLREGPPGASVREVEVAWFGYSGRFTDFSIRY